MKRLGLAGALTAARDTRRTGHETRSRGTDLYRLKPLVCTGGSPFGSLPIMAESMAVITVSALQLSHSGVDLFDRADLSLEAGEHVGLVGRNGSGKSTLLRILSGEVMPDRGDVQRQRGLRIASVPQEADFGTAETVQQAIGQGLADVISLIEQYSTGLGDLHQLQNAIEARDGWNWQKTVEQVALSAGLALDQPISTMSGGTRKRTALARALVSNPDVLLLDEPTNHLDLDSILWLEDLLRQFPACVLTVTHDRSFLDRVATRIIELDRGQLRSYPGNFSAFLDHKEARLAQEAVTQAKADRLLAQEEVWIRKGVEARRTRSQSRVHRLEVLRTQRASRRQAVGQVRMELDRGALSGRLVAELEDCSLSFGGADLVHKLSATILRGDKIGLIGANGVGKTSLLKLILGEHQPTTGTVRRGTQVQVAYFDQMREQIDLDASLEDFISPGSEWIEIGQQRKHVRSYLGDFLFSADRARSPVRMLSGGERNRLLLARLFARPANVLVLDEPTNDLDIDTLELLEDLLQRYQGTVFLVSHDRTFLDQVVTSTLVHEGSGHWREYEGGIQDWLDQSARSKPGSASGSPVGAPKPAARSDQPRQKAADQRTPITGLSSKEQRLLAEAESRIGVLEAELAQAAAQLTDGTIFQRDPQGARTLAERHAQLASALEETMLQWEALAARA